MTDPGTVILLGCCGIYYIGHCVCFSFSCLKEAIERRRLEPVLIQGTGTSWGNFIASKDITDDFTLTENN